MRKKIRIIARLDIKSPYVVKGIQMEGLRKVGFPHELSKKYYQQGIDELLYIDIVASLYDRNSLLDVIHQTTEKIFIPITVGGGIRSVEDAKKILQAGADKIAINTAAIKNPSLISKLAEAFGSQCVVVSIHAKKTGHNQWEAYYDSGRERTGINVIEWAQRVERLGAGELLITSVDKDGTQGGCDCELIRFTSEAVSIPVIAAGGIGSSDDVVKVVSHGDPNAIAIASALHFEKTSVIEIREELKKHHISTRYLPKEVPL